MMLSAVFINNKKWKIETANMTTFLVYQHNYSFIDIGLFKNKQVIEKVTTDKTLASKNIIPLTDTLLKKHNIKLDETSFIAVNQGPGPFTTLRTVIATVNGISFASQIPLIGIDGLKALATEYHRKGFVTITLLNAYSNDVYWAITNKNGQTTSTGCENILKLLQAMAEKYCAKDIYFIGNAALLHKELIEDFFEKKLSISDGFPQNCSIEQIASEALDKFQGAHFSKTYKVTPLYLKHGKYKIANK
mgnify:CR=1 FL=1